MNTKKFAILALVAASSLSLAACGGKTVQPGNAGVKVVTLGSNAGKQQAALTPGWHATGFGESIEEYPTIQKTYPFSNQGDAGNEELTFTDRTGLPMTADVAVTLRVLPTAAPAIYSKYRQDFDTLLTGPIRNDIRSAVAAETELVGVEQLLAGGRQVVLGKALKRVQTKWAKEGVEISQLEWIGTIRFPNVILESIKARTQADQETLAAQARVAVAEANAQEKIAVARGDAEAANIRGAALRANPQNLQQQAIEKWDGVLPQVMGSNATPFVNLK